VGELFIALQEQNKPRNVKEAISSPSKDRWIKAMENDMVSMKVNKVYGVSTFHRDIKLLGTNGFSNSNTRLMA